MRFGYVRVSSNYQNEARQVAALKKCVVEEHIIIEKASGKDFVNRIEYQRMKKLMLRAGDELFVTSIDRLGRNKEQIADELRDLKKMGVKLRILDIPVTLQSPPDGEIAKLFYDTMMEFMIGIMSSFAHAEHIYIKQRQAEGIEQWRMTGKTKSGRPYGRPPIKIPKNFYPVVEQWKLGNITATQAMALTGIKRTSFYKLVKNLRTLTS